MKEKTIQNQIRIDLSTKDSRVFRNHVGTGYSTYAVTQALDAIYDPFLKKKIESILNKGFVSFGFGEGSSDLIGIKSVKVTPEMVGKNIGVFCAIECKSPSGNTSASRLEKQNKFINVINSLGGRAGFATSSEMAERILNYER